MTREITYTDGGRLVMEDCNNSDVPELRAEGVQAHKVMFRIHAIERQRGAWFNHEEMRKLFDGINNCTIILA